METGLWLTFALYALHELEEIAMIKPWAQRVRERPARDPAVQRRREADTFARRYRSIRGEAAALAILIQTMLVMGIIAIADLVNEPGILAAILIVHGVHLIAHLGMAISARACTPGVVTAIVTLPPVVLLAAGYAARSGLPPAGIAAWTAGIMVLLVAELAALRRIEGGLSRFLDRYAGCA